jgi:hypothetical protein
VRLASSLYNMYQEWDNMTTWAHVAAPNRRPYKILLRIKHGSGRSSSKKELTHFTRRTWRVRLARLLWSPLTAAVTLRSPATLPRGKMPRKPAQTDLQQESRFGKTEAEKKKIKAAAEHGGGHTPPAAPPSLSLPAAMSNASSLALYYYRCCWLCCQ